MGGVGANVLEGSTDGFPKAGLGRYCLLLASLLAMRDAPLTASLKAG